MKSRKELTIMQMNDSHAYFELHTELFWSGNRAEYRMAGGYARIAGALAAARKENPGRVLAFDNGDTIHGTRAAVATQGGALLPLLNRLGFDAMTAHWEFAYGPQHLKEFALGLHYPLLAINCYDNETGKLVFPPYLVKEVNGVRAGIIGIASNIVDKVMPASYSAGVRFTLGNEELPGYIAQLRNDEKADIVIVVSHLGFPQEMKLAQEVPGIDVLLSGHTHNRLYRPAFSGRTILIQSGCHGSFLGRLDLTIENKRVADFRHRLLVMEEAVAPDPEVERMIGEVLKPYREELNRTAGYTGTALNRNTILESTMDNFLLQSLCDASGTRLAFSNGWRYGAPVPEGPVSVNDLYNIVPMDPPVETVDITGDEIRTMMEESLERTFARDPYLQMGGYVKRCRGINVYFKMENPKGYRVQELFIGGERAKPDKTYTAAFVTSQGVPKGFGTNRRKTGINAVEAMQRYLSKKKTVHAELQGSVTAV